MRLSPTQHAAVVSGAKIAKEPRGRRWEDMLATQLYRAGIRFEREYRFDPERKFRFDFRIRDTDLAIEVDGGVHTVRARFTSDTEKHQLALVAGFRVLRVSPEQVRTGAALGLVKRLLQPSGKAHPQHCA